jgi:hypothetical protein
MNSTIETKSRIYVIRDAKPAQGKNLLIGIRIFPLKKEEVGLNLRSLALIEERKYIR